MADSNFLNELSSLINRYSKENGSDTPDFILAEYLQGCLENFDRIVRSRETWHGRGKQDEATSNYLIIPSRTFTPEQI